MSIRRIFSLRFFSPVIPPLPVLPVFCPFCSIYILYRRNFFDLIVTRPVLPVLFPGHDFEVREPIFHGRSRNFQDQQR